MGYAAHTLDETALVDANGQALMGMLYGKAEFEEGRIAAISINHAPTWDKTTGRWLKSNGVTRIEPPDRASTPYEKALWMVLEAAVLAQLWHELEDTRSGVGTDDLAPIRL